MSKTITVQGFPVGIIVKAGRYGGTYAHKDIAFEFCSAISPDYPHLTLEAISACSDFSAIESDLADSHAGRGSTVQDVREKFGLSL